MQDKSLEGGSRKSYNNIIGSIWYWYEEYKEDGSAYEIKAQEKYKHMPILLLLFLFTTKILGYLFPSLQHNTECNVSATRSHHNNILS